MSRQAQPNLQSTCSNSDDFVRPQRVSRHSPLATQTEQPVYGILPSYNQVDIQGRPVYDLRELEDSDSVVITYPVAVSYSPTPPNTNNDTVLVDPASAKFHYATTVVSKGTKHHLPAFEVYGSGTQRASSAPPRSVCRDNDVGQTQTAPPTTHREDEKQCSSQQSVHSSVCNIDINAVDTKSASQQRRADMDSDTPIVHKHAGRTPRRPPIPFRSASSNVKIAENMQFPSPSSASISRTESNNGPLTDGSNQVNISRPNKPPITTKTRARYQYRYQPPRILAARDSDDEDSNHSRVVSPAHCTPAQQTSNEPKSPIKDKGNESSQSDTKTKSDPSTSRARKRRQRRKQFVELQRRMFQMYAGANSPTYISSWDEDSTEDEVMTDTATPRKRNRRQKRKQKTPKSPRIEPTKSTTNQSGIHTVVKATREKLRQTQIDEYLRYAQSQPDSQCLLCTKRKYMPSHYIECPNCGKSYIEQDDGSQSCSNARNENTRTAKNVSESTRVRLHPDIVESLRFRRKFGITHGSPPQSSLFSVPSATQNTTTTNTQSGTQRVNTTVSPAVASPIYVIAEYNQISEEIEHDYQRYNKIFPELIDTSKLDRHPHHNNEARPQTQSALNAPTSPTRDYSPLPEEYSWRTVESRHLQQKRRDAVTSHDLPDNDTMLTMMYRAYNKQYSREDLDALSSNSKLRIFQQLLYNLRDAERFDLQSPIHQSKPASNEYLSVLDKYRFKPQVSNESNSIIDKETMSDIDEATATDSDHIMFENLRTPSSTERRPQQNETSNDNTLTPTRDSIVLRAAMPILSPVVGEENEIIAFELPPPIPVAAEPPLRASQQPDIMQDFVFEERLRKTGLFGRHKLNAKDLNTVCVHFLFQLLPKKISVKCFYKRRETTRSKAIHCVFEHDPKTQGLCKYCEQKKSHQACRFGACNDAFLKYKQNPNSNDLWRALSVSHGNNAMLLTHFYAKHLPIIEKMRLLVVKYCEQKPEYIQCVLVGVHKYAAIKNRRQMHRRQEQVDKRIDEETSAYFAVVNTVSQGNIPPVNEAAQIHKTIASGWTVSKHLCIINTKTPDHIQSGCPRGHEKGEVCTLRPDGTTPRKSVIFDLHQVMFVFVDRYKCRRHKYMKMPCTAKTLKLVSGDHFNYGLLRVGNGFLTPQFVSWLMAKYVTVKYRIRKLRIVMNDEYARTWIKHGYTQWTLNQVKKVMLAYIPTETTLNKYLRTGQKLVYSTSLRKQLSLCMRTNINVVGIDQTFGRVSNLKGSADSQANVGLATAVSPHSLILKLGILNNQRENSDQLSRFAGELKGDLLLHGNCEYLSHCGFFWGSDNYKNTQNLPTTIEQFLSDQLQTNPNYAALKAKLSRTGHTLQDFKDTVIECQMHKFMRDYKALKVDGVTPATHGDHHAYCHEHISMMNSIQHGVHTMDKLVECDWVNLAQHEAKDGYVRAIAWFHFYREQLEHEGLDDAIFTVLESVLQLESIHDFKEKHEQIVRLKASDEYKQSHEALDSLTGFVHPMQRRWILGRWINAEGKTDTRWHQKISIFQDGNKKNISVYPNATTQWLANIVNRFFMRNPLEANTQLLLHPMTKWIHLMYIQLRGSIVHKRCESKQSQNPPLWEYAQLRKQWELASRPKSIDAMIATRNPEFSGVWLNVLNEQAHSQMNEIFTTIRSSQNIECILQDLNVQQYELNDTKLTRLTASDTNTFSEEFKDELKSIRDEKEKPALFQKITEQGLIYDASDVYSKLVDEAAAAMEHRQIDITHNRVMKRNERMILGQEITLRKPKKITVNLVVALHAKYRKSVTVIIRELLRYGIPSDVYEGNGEPITASPGKIYEAIKLRKFEPLSFLPPLNDENNTQSMPLPSIPTQYTANESTNTAEPSPAAIAPLVQCHSAVLKAVKHLNDNVPFLLVDLQKLHALSFEDYTEQDFMLALLDNDRRRRVWKNVFSQHQSQCISRFVGDMNNVHGLFAAAGVECSNTRLFDASYSLSHELQPEVSINALTLNYGGDATTNYRRYDAEKKRSASSAGLAGNGQSKKPRKAGYKQCFKFDKKKEDEYKKPIARQCDCDYHEVKRKKEFKFGAFLSGADCLKELEKISMYSINEGGKNRLKTYCVAHAWTETETHGQSAAFLKDWLVAHLLLGSDIKDMSREEIESLFVQNKLLKKRQQRKK